MIYFSCYAINLPSFSLCMLCKLLISCSCLPFKSNIAFRLCLVTFYCSCNSFNRLYSPLCKQAHLSFKWVFSCLIKSLALFKFCILSAYKWSSSCRSAIACLKICFSFWQPSESNLPLSFSSNLSHRYEFNLCFWHRLVLLFGDKVVTVCYCFSA